jgi:hypothetical protein
LVELDGEAQRVASRSPAYIGADPRSTELSSRLDAVISIGEQEALVGIEDGDRSEIVEPAHEVSHSVRFEPRPILGQRLLDQGRDLDETDHGSILSWKRADGSCAPRSPCGTAT